MFGCPRCGGTGETAVEPVPVNPENRETEECWVCRGTGDATPTQREDYEEFLAFRDNLYRDQFGKGE